MAEIRYNNAFGVIGVNLDDSEGSQDIEGLFPVAPPFETLSGGDHIKIVFGARGGGDFEISYLTAFDEDFPNDGTLLRGQEETEPVNHQANVSTWDNNPTAANFSDGGGGLESVVAGDGILVDDTDPDNPVVSTNLANVSFSGGLRLYDDSDVGIQIKENNTDVPAQFGGTNAQIVFPPEFSGPDDATNLAVMYQINSRFGTITFFQGAGSPVGVITPFAQGDTYYEVDDTPGQWMATDGGDNTAWVQVSGG